MGSLTVSIQEQVEVIITGDRIYLLFTHHVTSFYNDMQWDQFSIFIVITHTKSK